MISDMTPAPTSPSSPPAVTSEDATELPGEHFTPPPPEPIPTASDSTLVDQSGRPLGARALKTRERILDATLSLLDEKSMRELRVIDIARIIGSSPATFYQYFKDIEDVVLELSKQIDNAAPEIVEMIRGDWEGRAGHERGRRLAYLFIEHWNRYASILRVRNNAAEEGDQAFMDVRLQTLLPIVSAFADIIRKARPITESMGDEWKGGALHPISAGFVLTGAVEGMVIHHKKFEKRFGIQGEGQNEIIETIATVIQITLTSDS